MTQFDYPELDEKLYREVLPNGLTVAVVPRRGFARSIAYFVTNFGSIHTDFRLEGEEYRAPAGQTADRYIEELAAEIGNNYAVRVASSDGLVQLSSFRSGVLRMSARELREEVENAHREMGKFFRC